MLHVLVIDDNTDMTASLSMLLRLWGCDVLCANDGPSGLELAREYQADLVLLDLSMPGMTGYEVAQQLRGLPWGQGMLLVAMSGLTGEQFRRRASESGFDVYLTKPGGVEELKEILSVAAELRRVQDRARPTAAAVPGVTRQLMCC